MVDAGTAETDRGGTPRWISGAEVVSALPARAAIDVLEQALLDGLDPEGDGRRTRLGTATGELLLMPSTAPWASGVKLISVAPDNPGAGRPLVQGVYVVFDGATLQPTAVLDGAAITTLRTPAVSALAVRHLTSPAPVRLAILGTGVQAWGHLLAVAAVRPVAHLSVIGRTAANVEAFVDRARLAGFSADGAGPEALPSADVVVCATSAERPLFDGRSISDRALVVAVGSHSPGAREVDSGLVARSQVVVESLVSALDEAGDVVIPLREGVLRESDLLPLAAVVRGSAPIDLGRPRFFKSTGMPWQDLVTAAAVVDRTAPVTAHASPHPSTAGGVPR